MLEQAMSTCDDIIKEHESWASENINRRITSQSIVQQTINMSSLKERIDAILHDGTMSRKEKLSRLTSFVTPQEARALLGPEPEETIVLKKKLNFQGGELKILDLSINKVFFKKSSEESRRMNIGISLIIIVTDAHTRKTASAT